MSELRKITGKCAKCGKRIVLGIDGSCPKCHTELCWTCWEAAGHACPICEQKPDAGPVRRCTWTLKGKVWESACGSQWSYGGRPVHCPRCDRLTAEPGGQTALVDAVASGLVGGEPVRECGTCGDEPCTLRNWPGEVCKNWKPRGGGK